MTKAKKPKTVKKEIKTDRFSYRNYEELSRFLTDRARILGRKHTGLTPKQQRYLTRAIKQSRHLGLLPYKPQI